MEEFKSLTYENVAKELFEKQPYYYISPIGTICLKSGNGIDSNSATSEKQLEKLLAINKLMNIAKYLNGDWKPDWDYNDEKWYITIDINNKIKTFYTYGSYNISVYFKTKELAKQAIDILGEETIRLALLTDW